MGYNTVAFILNDLSDCLERSPKTVAWMLAHPPTGCSRLEKSSLRHQAISVAQDNNEPMPHGQALEVLTSFHADCTQYYRAGQNCISELQFVQYLDIKGKKCVVLELPDYLQ